MQPTRREFLGGAALVYKLVGDGPALRAAGPNDQIGFGFIGSGIQGTHLLGQFQKIPGVRPLIVADLYDGYLERVKEQTDGMADTTKNHQEVLNRKDVDAVVIAVPDHLHKQMVVEALSAGKHVYIEKPMTWSIEEGPEIIEAEKRSGKLLQVGSQGKTAALTAKTRELVKSGALGRLNMVRLPNHRNTAEGAWVYPVPPDASPQTIDWNRFLGRYQGRPFDAKVFFRWRCWWDYSGGVATDLFVHLLTWLHEAVDAPAPKSVASQGGLYRWNDGRNVPDVLNSIFEYEPGFVVDMYVNLGNGRSAHGPLIMGSEGTLTQEGDKLLLYPEPPPREVQFYGSSAWPKAKRAAYYESLGLTPQGSPQAPYPPAKPMQEIPVERGPSHYEHFVLSLREGRPSRENATEGHYAAAAAHLANMAYRRGRRVSWDYRTGKVSEG